MLKRKAYNFFIEWKSNKKDECLLVKGARQVGKTYLIEQFGKENYANMVEINFIKNPAYKNIFDGDSLDPEDILKRISLLLPEAKLVPNNTLIFLDEIQNCSKARTALKFLAKDNRYDVIASGSLLGLHYGTDSNKEVESVESIPVGYETQYTMYSMDFEEYLWANGYSDENINYLKSFFISGQKVPDSINSKFESLFREFMIIGGMPEVVDTFISTKDFKAAKRKQQKILASYDDDIANHASKTEKPKIRLCYESIPSQLARENKKFSYAQIEKKSGAKKYSDSITWLKDANLVNASFNVHEPYVPLNANSNNNEFKLYIHDTGLLMNIYGDSAKQALLNNTMLGNAKGGLYENIIAESLIKKGYTLHYYKPSANSQEIEFIIEQNGYVIPIEVKAGNTSTFSLNEFIKNFNPPYAYKFINGNVGFSGNKRSLPHYMIMFI